jgi:hypothetical protein
LLGAAVAAPALFASGAAAVPESTSGAIPRLYARWGRALVAYARAEAAIEAFRTREYHAAHRAYFAIRGRWPLHHDFAADSEAGAAARAAQTEFQPFEDRINDLECAHLAALKRLLRAPAPDLSALALKIELAVDQEVATLEGGERCLARLKADGWRLARS